MKAKRIVTILLLIFVVGSIAYMAVKENRPQPSQNPSGEQAVVNSTVPPQDSNNSAVKQTNQLIVYYFHGDVRCVTCHKLQNYAKEALGAYFAKELASGEIVWQETNIDRQQNRHFIADYKLVTKSIILSKVSEGKESHWQNLDQIWQKVGNKDAYMQYIREGIKKIIEEQKS